MNLRLTRRNFVVGAGAFVALRAAGAEGPLWTAGIVTDTHVLRDRASCALVEKACELFAERNVDLFVNCGDIANTYTPEIYPVLKELTDAAFPSKPPRKIWVFANHDHINRLDEPFETVMADVRRLLGATNGLHDVIDFKGYPLVVLPQHWDVRKVTAMLSETAAKYPGKPIFVFDHIPSRGTTDDSTHWGTDGRRKMFAKYPQVIQISGHAHSSLRSELNVWQGEFTAVSVGCLEKWQGEAVGIPPEGKPNYGAVVMEVYPDRVVFRRFDVRTKVEYGADAPWTIPLPFVAATAPYRRERTQQAEPVPEFPSGAKLTLSADTPFAALSLAFPRAEGPHGTYVYKVQVVTPEGEQMMRGDLFGQFYLPETERSPVVVRKLSAGYFDPGARCRVRITPCNCFGRGGRPIESDFTVPERSGKILLDSRDPGAEFPFRTGLEGGELVRREGDWFLLGDGNYRLELPPAVWSGPKGTRFRFILDMESEQPGAKNYSIVLRNPKPVQNAAARVYTPFGSSGRMRYVIDFAKPCAESRYDLLIREGTSGKVKFCRLRLEKPE